MALAGISGLVWGVGDFAGGKATQTAAALPVAVLSKLFSLPLLTLYLALFYVPPSAASLAWGAMAGTVGMIGVVLFYRALSGGAMTVVAPISAVISAVIPVAVGLASGERPSVVRLTGVLCALLAVALVSLAPGRSGSPTVETGRLIGLAVAAGAGFGMFFVFLAVAGEAATGDPGMWPIGAAQLAALLLGAVLLAATGAAGWPRRHAVRWCLVAGPFDMSANAIFLVAAQRGDLSLVAPLAALYPVTTVLLALLVDHERLRRVQVVGLLLTLAALILVSR